jgi:hypothetical protein
MLHQKTGRTAFPQQDHSLPPSLSAADPWQQKSSNRYERQRTPNHENRLPMRFSGHRVTSINVLWGIRSLSPELQAPIARSGAHAPLRARAGEGNRTPIASLEGWSSTIELHPREVPARGSSWSGREDLNLRPPAPKAGALPGCATPRRGRRSVYQRRGER